MGGGEKDDDENDEEKKTTIASQYCAVDRCHKVLERLWDDPFAVSFIEPVDTELYDDYLDVVEQGMVTHQLQPYLLTCLEMHYITYLPSYFLSCLTFST